MGKPCPPAGGQQLLQHLLLDSIILYPGNRRYLLGRRGTRKQDIPEKVRRSWLDLSSVQEKEDQSRQRWTAAPQQLSQPTWTINILTDIQAGNPLRLATHRTQAQVGTQERGSVKNGLIRTWVIPKSHCTQTSGRGPASISTHRMRNSPLETRWAERATASRCTTILGQLPTS